MVHIKKEENYQQIKSNPRTVSRSFWKNHVELVFAGHIRTHEDKVKGKGSMLLLLQNFEYSKAHNGYTEADTVWPNTYE